MTEQVREPLEVMPDRDCVILLRSHDLGRIALVDEQNMPLIFPVNYFFDEGVVVFRTGPGSKLNRVPGAPVCFEIDGWDQETGVGWSVLAKGIAHDITDSRGMPTGRMKLWPVHPVAPGSREHWIGIWVTEITGRRFQTKLAERPGQPWHPLR
jgi:nitroimidazol reductase NimA-like FMN-containing flavoprotein (pyridoxamine 5'-phosphate oxidase superfamily)